MSTEPRSKSAITGETTLLRMTYKKDRSATRGYQAHVWHFSPMIAMFAAGRVTSACLSRIFRRDYHNLYRPLKPCYCVARVPSFGDGLEGFRAGIERYTVGVVVGHHKICTSACNLPPADDLSWKER